MQNQMSRRIVSGWDLHRSTDNREIPYNYDPEKVKLYLTGENSYLPVDTDILSKHIMLIGGIGSGKTNTFNQIISQLDKTINADDVMVIFDTKGDFYGEFYSPGDVVISNDNKSTDGTQANYWNIFNEIEPGSGEMASIIEIAKSLFAEQTEKTNNVFFPNAAKDIFTACLYHFLHSQSPKARTNYNLIRFIKSTPLSGIKEMLESYDEFRSMASYIEGAESSPQAQGVYSTLISTLNEIFIGNFARNGTLSLRNLVHRKGGKKVFIEYDLRIGNLLTPVYSLMYDMAIKESLGRTEGERGNVYFITDEFSLLPNLRHVDDAVNFGRSLGVKFMIGIQNIDQIYDNYGEERARSILSGFLTTFCFRVNDGHSREFVQQIFGKNQILDSYLSTNQSNGFTENQREGNVVEDWDFLRLNVGQAIIGFPNSKPFLFQFDRFPGKEAFLSKFQWPD